MQFGWDDNRSMTANNTSVYRPDFIGHPENSKASEHTRGSALDLNPLDNPMFCADGKIAPRDAIGRVPREDAVIYGNTAVIALFHEHNMEFGGFWNDPEHPTDFYGLDQPADQHHFELRPAAANRLNVPHGIWH